MSRYYSTNRKIKAQDQHGYCQQWNSTNKSREINYPQHEKEKNNDEVLEVLCLLDHDTHCKIHMLFLIVNLHQNSVE